MSQPGFEVRTPSFLLLRPDDHVIAGVAWSDVTADPAGGPSLTAGSLAWLLLVLPPQHVAEQTFPDPLPGGGAGSEAQEMLSGTSQVAVRLAAGARFEPTASSLLSLVDRSAPLAADRIAGLPGTRIELPWHLIVEPRTDGRPAALRTASATPVADAGDSLWRLRVDPGHDADTTDGGAVDPGGAPGPVPRGAALVAIGQRAEDTADPFPMALERAFRARVVAEAALSPAQLDRLELTALGGTLTARGEWDTFAWQHDTVLGRDMTVQVVASGMLYPFGHRAIYQRCVERVFDPAGGAVLRQVDLIVVSEPVVSAPADPRLRRAFPFDAVEVCEQTIPIQPPTWRPTPGSQGLDVFFRPATAQGDLRFRMRLRTAGPDLELRLPLLFVADLSPTVASLTDPQIASALRDEYGAVRIAIPATPIDLVRAASPAPEDVQEVRAVTIAGSSATGQFAPALRALEVTLPAMRALLDSAVTYPVTFSAAYLRDGTAARTLLDLVQGTIGLDFAERADRSGGLVAPGYAADALSRTLGPVVRAALPDLAGLVDPGAFFTADATILGLPLRSLLGAANVPPEVTSLLEGPNPVVSMTWKQVTLTSFAAFVARPTTTLDLTVTVTPGSDRDPAAAPRNDTLCTITDFTLGLPPGEPLLGLHVDRLTFHQRGGASPTVGLDGLRVEFQGALRLVEGLSQAVDLAGVGPSIDVSPSGITASYSLELPTVGAGAFVLSNVAIGASISIPFDRRPVWVTLSFARPANRFALTVLMFGGGGYLEIELTQDGLRRLDLVLEFGAMVALDFVVASAEVHALGGVRMQFVGSEVEVSGFLRIGGTVDILGLVSVSIELCVSLSYRSETNALVGRATLVVEIDLFLWSDSVELDSGEWVLAGGGGRPMPVSQRLGAGAVRDTAGGTQFDDYWSCFADEGAGDA